MKGCVVTLGASVGEDVDDKATAGEDSGVERMVMDSPATRSRVPGDLSRLFKANLFPCLQNLAMTLHSLKECGKLSCVCRCFCRHMTEILDYKWIQVPQPYQACYAKYPLLHTHLPLSVMRKHRTLQQTDPCVKLIVRPRRRAEVINWPWWKRKATFDDDDSSLVPVFLKGLQ